MSAFDRTVNAIAASDYGLVKRRDVLDCGGTDRIISGRLNKHRWTEVHPGVYLIGVTPLSWLGSLRAATLAAGEGSMASHRAALLLWGLDGISGAPLELTVPVTCGPTPAGVIVHRTRRPVLPLVTRGIPVAPVERTILDAAGCLLPVVVEQAFESAARRQLTTVGKMAACLAEQGTPGVRGIGVVVRLLESRGPGRAAGSPAETFLINRLRKAGVDEPVRQHAVALPDGTVAVVDIAWPWNRKGVEVDGLDAHASARALEYDLNRQNQLFEVRWQLRRYSARSVFRHPDQIVANIVRFLTQ